MNPLDLFCLMTFLSSGILGARRGFLHTSVTLFGWALSGFLLGKSYPALENQLQFLEFSPIVTSWLAASLCAIFVLWFFYFLSGWIRDFAHTYGFLEADKILGFFLGISAGWLGCTFILSGLKDLTEVEESRLWQTSHFVKLAEQWQESQEPVVLSAARRALIYKSNSIKESEDIFQSLKNKNYKKVTTQRSGLGIFKKKNQELKEKIVKAQNQNLDEKTEVEPSSIRKKFSKKPKDNS